MKISAILMTVLLSAFSLFAQPAHHSGAPVAGGDTTCGIVWYPPIQISPGIANVHESVPSMAVQGDTVHITWAFTSQKFPYRRSVNGGQSFEPVRELAPDSTPYVGNSLILSTGSAVYGFWIDFGSNPNKGWMIRSTTHGATWEQPVIVRDSTVLWHFSGISSDTLLLGVRRSGENRRVFRSTNSGSNWSESSSELIGNDPRIAMTPGLVHRVSQWGFDSAGVWSEFVVQYHKSTDLGETWSDSVNLSTMNTRAYEPAIAADGSDSASVIVAWKDAKYGCLTLGFCSIISRNLQLPDSVWSPEHVHTLEPRGAIARTAVDGGVMAVTWTAEIPPFLLIFIRISFDRGTTWCAPYLITGETSEANVSCVVVGKNTLHMAWSELVQGRRRVFYRRGVVLPTSVVEDVPVLPPFASLSQNYPNPFNPSTRIVYSVGASGIVRLKVYDLLGREVASLVEEKQGAGEYTVPWDASGLPSGVYYYRLRVVDDRGGAFVHTKKMVIIH